MGAVFNQTDTNAACGVRAACSGEALASATAAKKAIEGVNAGTTNVTVTIPAINGSSSYAAIMFELLPGVDYSQWAAGDYTVQLVIPSQFFTPLPFWEHTFICRLNNACTSLETIGSTVAQHIQVAIGTLSMVVSGALVSSPSSTDRIYAVLSFSAAVNRNFKFKPSGQIVTPLLVSSGGPIFRRRLEGY